MDALIVSNILLWGLLIALAFAVMGLVRQIGVLHGRLAPAGALMVDKGVAVNEPAPRSGRTNVLQYRPPKHQRDQRAHTLSVSYSSGQVMQRA